MSEKGFQLFECMIICFLLSLLAGVGGASYSQLVARTRLERAGQEMMGCLGALRAAAVNRRLSLSVTVDDNGMRYGFGPRGEEPTAWRHLPPGVQIVNRPASSVTFYSRGNAVPAGSYLLANEAAQWRLIIAPTGRMRWEHLE